MKKNTAFFVVSAVFLLVGCSSAIKKQDDSVIIERQECFLKHFTHLSESDCDLSIAIDIPVQCPQPLIDSITVFLNEQLYMYFDTPDGSLPYKSVFSTDLRTLVEHYRDAYSPFFNSDSTQICEFQTHCLELNMVAQTASYVTYEIVWIYFGEGLEEQRSWATFAKSDGHRLKEVATTEEMARFFIDYPEQRNDDVWEDVRNRASEGNSYSLNNVGLLNDSLVLQYSWCPGVYEESKYPLQLVKPYLSSEAQDLILK